MIMIYKWGGTILARNGALAIDERCCCLPICPQNAEMGSIEIEFDVDSILDPIVPNPPSSDIADFYNQRPKTEVTMLGWRLDDCISTAGVVILTYWFVACLPSETVEVEVRNDISFGLEQFYPDGVVTDWSLIPIGPLGWGGVSSETIEEVVLPHIEDTETEPCADGANIDVFSRSLEQLEIEDNFECCVGDPRREA